MSALVSTKKVARLQLSPRVAIRQRKVIWKETSHRNIASALLKPLFESHSAASKSGRALFAPLLSRLFIHLPCSRVSNIYKWGCEES